MLQQSEAAAHPASQVGIALVATCACVIATAASAATAGSPRAPTRYCAYDLGPNLIAEGINNRNQIAGTALVGDLTQAFVWDWQRGVRLLGVLSGASISIRREQLNLLE
jgi:hypothetical protein